MGKLQKQWALPLEYSYPLLSMYLHTQIIVYICTCKMR
jgi:hypothetical protein